MVDFVCGCGIWNFGFCLAIVFLCNVAMINVAVEGRAGSACLLQPCLLMADMRLRISVVVHWGKKLTKKTWLLEEALTLQILCVFYFVVF
jgi:hypothetical protein